MIFSFLARNETVIKLTNSNTQPLFSKIDVKQKYLRLVKVDDSTQLLSAFSFYEDNNEIKIPIDCFKKDFYNKAQKYLLKIKTKNKNDNLKIIKEGLIEVKKYQPEVEQNIIKSKEIRGVVSYNPILTKIFRLIETFIIREIELIGFKEIIIPKVTSWDTWLKTGHLISNYSEIFPVCKTTPQNIKDDCHRAFFQEKKPALALENIGGLTYSQCENFWALLRGNEKKLLEKDKISLFFDRSGPSYRQERKNLSGIKRLSEFRRIELIFVGSEVEVKKTIEVLTERYEKIYSKLLFSPRLSQVASWSDLKEGYTIDFEISFEKELLEVNNLSFNGNYYPIKFINNKILYSGCSGIGIDRLVYSLVTKHGIEGSTSILNKLLKK